jgi:hypothetical protein
MSPEPRSPTCPRGSRRSLSFDYLSNSSKPHIRRFLTISQENLRERNRPIPAAANSPQIPALTNSYEPNLHRPAGMSKFPLRSSSSAKPIRRNFAPRADKCRSCPTRCIVPCTTSVAPSLRKADVDSLTLRLRTTLHSDC